MLIRFAVCVLMGAARLVEVAYSRRNIARSSETREGDQSRQTYPLMVALHTATILGTFLLGGKRRVPWLLLLLAVQPLRYWVLATLRDNWNTRGAIPEDIEVKTDGPYAFVRHPNYVVVAIELATLPLAFGLRWLAVVASLANAVLLTIRIREEEALLEDIPAYRAHFHDKARFIPRIW